MKKHLLLAGALLLTVATIVSPEAARLLLARAALALCFLRYAKQEVT
jgi:hypothetical protein